MLIKGITLYIFKHLSSYVLFRNYWHFLLHIIGTMSYWCSRVMLKVYENCIYGVLLKGDLRGEVNKNYELSSYRTTIQRTLLLPLITFWYLLTSYVGRLLFIFTVLLKLCRLLLSIKYYFFAILCLLYTCFHAVVKQKLLF